MMMFSFGFSDFLKTQQKYYGTSKIVDDSLLTVVGMISFISSASSKFGWGAI